MEVVLGNWVLEAVQELLIIQLKDLEKLTLLRKSKSNFTSHLGSPIPGHFTAAVPLDETHLDVMRGLI